MAKTEEYAGYPLTGWLAFFFVSIFSIGIIFSGNLSDPFFSCIVKTGQGGVPCMPAVIMPQMIDRAAKQIAVA